MSTVDTDSGTNEPGPNEPGTNEPGLNEPGPNDSSSHEPGPDDSSPYEAGPNHASPNDADSNDADSNNVDPNDADLTATVEEQPTRSGFVAIIGKPNVGKSTLLNTMLGVKVAPITPKPQTTRRGVRGIYTHENRQLVFVDTPGLHRGGDTVLDQTMHREIRDAVVDVDLILWVVDLRRPPGDEDKDVARLLGGVPDHIPVIIVGNKLDAAKYPDEALRLYGELYPKAERSLALSALNDPKAVYALRDDLLDRLEEAPFFFPSDIRSDQSREQWVAELIREAAMIHLREEIPYSVAVQVVEWQDGHDDRPTVITAEIWVEKSGHRRMVIGKGGAMIKEIGKMARKQLEIFMQERLFLELEVVVRRDWRRDRESLRELGYEP